MARGNAKRDVSAPGGTKWAAKSRETARVLALETSSPDCSVALYLAGEIHERCAPEPLAHARYALSLSDTLLAEAGLRLADLDLICFGRGPGSFIGLRVAAGMAQGLAYAADLPLAPISSLAALAQAAPGVRLLCAMDARMGQVYWAAYQRDSTGTVRLQDKESLCSPETVPRPPGSERDWIGVGDAWKACGPQLGARLGRHLAAVRKDHHRPRASGLLPLALDHLESGELLPPERGLPHYLREQVAHRPPTDTEGPGHAAVPPNSKKDSKLRTPS